MQSAVGTAEADPEFVVFPTGNQLTSNTGDVLTSVEITGLGMTSSLGDEEQETSYEAPSVSATSNAGTVNIRTDVSFTMVILLQVQQVLYKAPSGAKWMTQTVI